MGPIRDYTVSSIEFVAGVTGGTISIGLIVGGALWVDFSAYQCLPLVVISFVTLNTPWNVRLDLTVGILWIADDAFGSIVKCNSKAGIAERAGAVGRIVLATLIDTLTLSLIIYIHPEDALPASVGFRIEMQAVGVALDFLNAAYYGFAWVILILRDKHGWNLVKVRVAFDALA